MIEILFEHPWFLVINKPSGILTQSVEGVDSVQKALVQQLQMRNAQGPVPFIGMPHRLDRVTTGVMVVARNQRALSRLSVQFASRAVEKSYVALVPGPIPVSDRYVDFVRKIVDVAKAEIVPPDTDGAREAILNYRVVRDSKLQVSNQSLDVALVEIILETGRMHQIRVQFASRGHPILGDLLYGSKYHWGQGSNDEREHPIALHSYRLAFRHPQTAERLVFEAPIPTEWNLERLENDDAR